jgi:hypothetical protein
MHDALQGVHEKIREDPVHAKKERVKPSEVTLWHTPKSTYAERKDRLKAKLATLMGGDDE